MKKQARYPLGSWQVRALSKLSIEGAPAHEIVGMLCGRARNWKSRYFERLRNAVVAHNSGRAKNSPVSQIFMIQAGHYGECGEFGYRLVHMKHFPGLMNESLSLIRGKYRTGLSDSDDGFEKAMTLSEIKCGSKKKK